MNQIRCSKCGLIDCTCDSHPGSMPPEKRAAIAADKQPCPACHHNGSYLMPLVEILPNGDKGFYCPNCKVGFAKPIEGELYRLEAVHRLNQWNPTK